ncbi:hypothetical protein CsSME_00002599 [Camellia sinensis var. sinensis]
MDSNLLCFVFCGDSCLEIRLMGGRGRKKKTRCTLGYTPWPNRKKTWCLNMYDQLKEV